MHTIDGPVDPYRDHADLLADELLSSTNLLDPVSDDFAENSDEGYGQWMPADAGDEQDGDGDSEEGAEGTEGTDHLGDPYDLELRRGRDLTAEEEANLAALGQVISDPADRGLVSADGRGAFVHTDEEVGAGDASPAMEIPLVKHPWWRLKWLNLARRSHRIGAAIGITTLVAGAVTLISTAGGDHDASPSSAAPAFTVPTVTEQAEPGPGVDGPRPGGDGPVGIKRADARCTAGSTNPMLAFDNDLETAWMCVPAYGVPGTVLRVEFDNWWVVSGACITPGWNRMNPDGSDEWVKHKTAAVVEYQFNDPDETRITQDTANIRDEVCSTVQPVVLASAMTITIREFGTPTGVVADVTSVPGRGATLAGEEPAAGDLRDFAVSSFAIIGHRAA